MVGKQFYKALCPPTRDSVGFLTQVAGVPDLSGQFQPRVGTAEQVRHSCGALSLRF